jgi:uncharacterized protein YaeQ
VSAKYVFSLHSEERRRPLPGKILLAQEPTEDLERILLRLFGYLLFYRDRIQVQTRLDDDYLSFVPDLVQLNYEGRIALWVDCGEYPVARLDRLAVKAPEAEIWSVQSSPEKAEQLARKMASEKFRKNRYGLVGLDPGMLEEVAAIAKSRNVIAWYRGDFDPGLMQFEFNGLWFESEFVVLHH